MITNSKARITKDTADKKIIVLREFDAPVDQVWKAWTESNLLDQWWAPKPGRAETKTMDFKEGEMWLYCMVGPEGERHWARVDFQTIFATERYTAVDSFCDEQGNKSGDMPSMHWHNEFSQTDTGTRVTIEISFSNQSDMDKIIEMGFEEGFTSGLGNLDELLAKG